MLELLYCTIMQAAVLHFISSLCPFGLLKTDADGRYSQKPKKEEDVECVHLNNLKACLLCPRGLW